MPQAPELMAPAGDPIALEAAIAAGADAVYLGVEAMNMRSAAANFSLADLPQTVARCHRDGVRCYLALNSLVFQAELGLLETILDGAQAAGIDAVIVADLACLLAAHRRGLAIHCSTQLSIANAPAIRHYHEAFGVERVVLARECSLADINAIRADLGDLAERIEIEVFVHGAMCVAQSGRCFMSQFACGGSANRGACQQPCRREYRIVDDDDGNELVIGNGYVMSPEDLCTLPFIERLLEAGVAVCKIEGRMRKPEYVDTVVRTYRQAIDMWAAEADSPGFAARFADAKTTWMAALGQVYNRGFSSGFFMGQPIDQWTARPDNQATHSKQFVGPVVNFYQRPGVAEVQVQSHAIAAGDELVILGQTTGLHRQVIESLQIDGQDVTRADQGQAVGIKLDAQVRRNDQVYVLRAVAPA